MLDDDFDSRILAANGQRLHAVIAGEGPLVLLCHGFPKCWYSWRHQLSALADAGYRAVALDMRGYGRSSKPPDVAAYRISELVADCVGVVQALGSSSAVIVGHDWGAPVAWSSAWTRPDVFRAVVGVSVPFGGRGLVALPGDPFGEFRPSVSQRKVAGLDLLVYQEFFNLPGAVAERAAERDLRHWLSGVYYSFSASPPLPEALAGVDLTQLADDMIIAILRSAMCVSPGGDLDSVMQFPDAPLEWLSDDDLDFMQVSSNAPG